MDGANDADFFKFRLESDDIILVLFDDPYQLVFLDSVSLLLMRVLVFVEIEHIVIGLNKRVYVVVLQL